MWVTVGGCVRVVLCVASDRQRERLRVKLTADRPVQGQRAQTNLISDGCLSDDPQTVTPMGPPYHRLSCWTLTVVENNRFHCKNLQTPC